VVGSGGYGGLCLLNMMMRSSVYAGTVSFVAWCLSGVMDLEGNGEEHVCIRCDWKVGYRGVV
jgi:hypothetical protein